MIRRDSFNNIARWLEEARLNGNPKLTFFLVGNKCDMEDEFLLIHTSWLGDKFHSRMVLN